VIRDESDVSWEKWGRENPYYGVLSQDKFRQKNLDRDRKAEFLASGATHIERVTRLIAARFGPPGSRKAALDFGCGVGRLVIPLARYYEKAVGVDISPSMLKIAAENCAESGLGNCSFVRSDDLLSEVRDEFDFIHSYIVFQHIPTQRGEQLIGQLVRRLSQGGLLAIHFPIQCTLSKARRTLRLLAQNFYPALVMRNLLLRRKWNEPHMQMNLYDLNRILASLLALGIKDVVIETHEAVGFVFAFLFAKKNDDSTLLSIAP